MEKIWALFKEIINRTLRIKVCNNSKYTSAVIRDFLYEQLDRAAKRYRKT